MEQRNVLYRFYDESDVLLYIGISMTPWERFRQHRADKPWWDAIRKTTMEPYLSRAAVLQAEKDAIESESPLHNVMHNRRTRVSRSTRVTTAPDSTTPIYAFQSRSSGTVHADALSLLWEIDGMSISDDYLPHDVSAAELFGIWRDRYVPDLNKPMRIWWFIGGPRTKIEFAHITPDDPPNRSHWLNYYTLPKLLPTCEPASLRSLPVRDLNWSGSKADKGGFVQEHCNWKPLPLRGWVTGYELLQSARRSAVSA